MLTGRAPSEGGRRGYGDWCRGPRSATSNRPRCRKAEAEADQKLGEEGFKGRERLHVDWLKRTRGKLVEMLMPALQRSMLLVSPGRCEPTARAAGLPGSACPGIGSGAHRSGPHRTRIVSDLPGCCRSSAHLHFFAVLLGLGLTLPCRMAAAAHASAVDSGCCVLECCSCPHCQDLGVRVTVSGDCRGRAFIRSGCQGDLDRLRLSPNGRLPGPG